MATTRIGGGDRIPRQRRFTQSGTWVVPAGVKWVKARIVGGGASGRARLVNVDSWYEINGTAGGQVIDATLSVTPGTSMSVTVAATTLAPVYNNVFSVDGVAQSASSGAASSFGGVTALGGNPNNWPYINGVPTYSGPSSAGEGSGYGGYVVNTSRGLTNALPIVVDAGSGKDFFGAGSGAAAPSLYSSNAFTQPVFGAPGVGGVGATVIPQFIANVPLFGIDAPVNTGAAGGSITAVGGNGNVQSFRGGNGGSGIVILDWEESA